MFLVSLRFVGFNYTPLESGTVYRGLCQWVRSQKYKLIYEDFLVVPDHRLCYNIVIIYGKCACNI